MPKTIFDTSSIDLNAIKFGPDFIGQLNPQRHEFIQLDAVSYSDEKKICGYKDVKDDEFWVKGHIPGRPLLPGVLMIEAAAQLASFFTKHVLKYPGFIGFGGVEECKFRLPVEPGVRLYIILELQWDRHRRVCCRCQGIVKDQIVFEATIIGTML
jgi:3-hydroxyacyl-[acyl-carrier-protein] dehydratase